ncbi:MAG TPA: 6-pyruvoyl-tetrahydropterin synthase-related protein [Candidatus Saccharimonadia bacterium]|nr:6-pyruvoyl-tetrahydropterin synthase-related protein [Candidatus Saccharimonadia bacterium]
MKRTLVALVCVVVVLLSLRTLLNNTFFNLHDNTHVGRLAEMHRGLLDGQFPVRWSQNLGYGYGMPLFSFYGPTPYYLAEVFHLTGFSYLVSIKLLLGAMTVFAFVGMYLLCSRWFGRVGGLIAAVVFVVFPYRAVDVFVRGAFNEIFAVSAVPWILWATVKIRESKNKQWIGWYSIFLLIFLTTHNLMTLMFLPIIYAFGLLGALSATNKKRYLLRFHVSFVLGILAACFFILPITFEKGYTQVDQLTGGYSNYKYHFLYIRQLFTGKWGYGGSILGPEDGLSFSLGILQIVLAAVGGVVWFIKTRKPTAKLLPVFLTIVTAIALFLTLVKSTPIWDSIPAFAYFQFPWRFLSVPTLTIPILAGATVFLIKNAKLRMLFGLVVIVAVVAVNLQYFHPEKFLDNPSALYSDDPVQIQTRLSETIPDYLPMSMKVIQAPGQAPVEIDGLQPSEITTLVARSTERLYSFTLQKPSTMTIRIAWYPNWTVYDGPNKIPFTVDPQSGFIKIALQPGQHLIAARLEDTPLRAGANLLSVVGLLLIAGVFLYDRHR